MDKQKDKNDGWILNKYYKNKYSKILKIMKNTN